MIREASLVGPRCPWIIFAGKERETDKLARRESRKINNNVTAWLFIKCTRIYNRSQERSLRPGHVVTIFSWPGIRTHRLARNIPFLLIPLKDVLICEFL